jgi:hypothetical protein
MDRELPAETQSPSLQAGCQPALAPPPLAVVLELDPPLLERPMASFDSSIPSGRTP